MSMIQLEIFLNLSLSSDNDNIAEIYDGADAIYTDNEKGSTKITYELKSVKSGNVVFTDTLPCTVLFTFY